MELRHSPQHPSTNKRVSPKGIGELEAGESIGAGRVRRPGGGRKPLSETDPRLLVDLERLVDEDRRGDPESLLLWTSKSVRHLAGGLRELGHQVEYVTVAKLMRSGGVQPAGEREDQGGPPASRS